MKESFIKYIVEFLQDMDEETVKMIYHFVLGLTK